MYVTLVSCKFGGYSSDEITDCSDRGCIHASQERGSVCRQFPLWNAKLTHTQSIRELSYTQYTIE